jgi:hypothetical protein
MDVLKQILRVLLVGMPLFFLLGFVWFQMLFPMLGANWWFVGWAVPFLSIFLMRSLVPLKSDW